MTTVAYDGKTMAADSQITRCGTRGSAIKAHRTADGRRYGFAGEVQDGIAVLLWLESGQRDDEKPSVGEDFRALLVNGDGTVLMLEDRLIPYPVIEGFTAIGSGYQYALAAMALGLSAEESVRLASQFDVHTNDVVITLNATPATGGA